MKSPSRTTLLRLICAFFWRSSSTDPMLPLLRLRLRKLDGAGDELRAIGVPLAEPESSATTLLLKLWRLLRGGSAISESASWLLEGWTLLLLKDLTAFLKDDMLGTLDNIDDEEAI